MTDDAPGDEDAPDEESPVDASHDADTVGDETETHESEATADETPVSEAQAWAEPGSVGDDEDALDPSDLDISDRDGVKTTDEGQFVISTDGDAIDPDVPPVRVVGETGAETDASSASGDGERPDDAPTHSGRGGRGDTADPTDDPLTALERDLRALSARRGFAVVVRDGETTGSIQTATNDRAAALETVLRWYAGRVDAERPTEETLRELLAETGLSLGLDDTDAG
ncbi:hypothetical protein RYH80_03690 [Halobaculum sp. MBLA0147]|uniref:DUF7500 family protein n=1 Tax=Halobaculum sp. MBLA0147 TaxID=3079934 RepID=UPI00352578C5